MVTEYKIFVSCSTFRTCQNRNEISRYHIYSDIENFVNSCDTFQEFKNKKVDESPITYLVKNLLGYFPLRHEQGLGVPLKIKKTKTIYLAPLHS